MNLRALALAALLLLVPVAALACGDENGDGEVNILDQVICLQAPRPIPSLYSTEALPYQSVDVPTPTPMPTLQPTIIPYVADPPNVCSGCADGTNPYVAAALGTSLLPGVSTATTGSYVAAPSTAPRLSSGGTYVFPASTRISGWRLGSKGGRHAGTDYGCAGDNVATAAGTVTTAALGWNAGYGNMVRISHAGATSTYGHFSTLYVKAGDQVAQGEALGRCGSSGNSTGPHLHFELRVGGVLVDPESYLQ